jgi:hypothetical protein
LLLLFQDQLVVRWKSGKAVRKIGTGQRGAMHALSPCRLQARQIGCAIRTASGDDAPGDRGENWLKSHDRISVEFFEILLQ